VSASQVWLTILGGAIAGAVGLLLFFVQRSFDRRDAQADALRQFADALMPLLIEFDRWRYDPDPDRTTFWVGASRQLPKLGTWIVDPEENARKPPDWERIGELAQAVERLWVDQLSVRVSDSSFDAKWRGASGHLFHLTLKSGANPRAAAEEAEEDIIELLDAIKKRTGAV
jgi:hypothetical protein